ncbi:hypothetical protein BDA96_07G227400 [Sorghum bicolor]|uniref:Uncharacterized protein n=2 Tax=Sorghum bicolor TaxID=4558 RepID=A0A921UAT3_SORBI|nr:hypothetical protein BDA96_07G227400 [Sorghum bicolor]OQU80960.1 hypothetical protein SORBI_3007G214050 [Sorghum bicolor]
MRTTPSGSPLPQVHDIGSSPIEIVKVCRSTDLSFCHESQKREFRALSHGVEADNLTPKFSLQ